MLAAVTYICAPRRLAAEQWQQRVGQTPAMLLSHWHVPKHIQLQHNTTHLLEGKHGCLIPCLDSRDEVGQQQVQARLLRCTVQQHQQHMLPRRH
jgi:hypothetical protein